MDGIEFEPPRARHKAAVKNDPEMLCLFRRSFRTTLTLLNCWRVLQARLLLSHTAQEDGIGDVAVEQERRKFTRVERVGPQPIERKQLEKERECRKRGKFSGFRRLKFVY